MPAIFCSSRTRPENIGLEKGYVEEAESLIDYQLAIDSNIKKIKCITKSEIDHILEVFGDSLNLKIGVSPSLFEITNGICNREFEDACKSISTFSDTLGIRIEVTIDKSKILDKFHENHPKCNIIFYIFINNLIKFLKSSLIDLDTNLIKKSCQPIVILVSESKIYYRGPLLAIIGVNEYDKYKDQLGLIDKKWLEWINRYHKASFYSLNWVDFN